LVCVLDDERGTVSRMRTAASSVVLTLALTLVATPAAAQRGVARVSGSDRITTAVAVAEASGAADTALLATARNYPDALAAAALARRVDAPLLLTEPGALPAPVADALPRLGVREVVILGGPGAVSDAVEARLRDEGYRTRRAHGPSRYATAAAVARLAAPDGAAEVALALGEHVDPDDAWPDAVAAASLAAVAEPVPVLLTRGEALPAETEHALRDLRARTVVVVGGEGSIGDAVTRRLDQLGYAVRRLSGPSRYDTAVTVAREALARGTGGEIVLASGSEFPDALTAGAFAARRGAPLALVASDTLPAPVERLLRERDRAGATVVGGTAAVSERVVDAVSAALTRRGDERVVAVQEGRGTWYGPGFEGARTACGDTFRPEQELTAAHRELACGTRVRVTNLENGRQVTVEITDRGPADPDLIIDVSALAAEQLQMKDDGTVDMRLEILGQ
jgi:putative cell wall-binding protein